MTNTSRMIRNSVVRPGANADRMTDGGAAGAVVRWDIKYSARGSLAASGRDWKAKTCFVQCPNVQAESETKPSSIIHLSNDGIVLALVRLVYQHLLRPIERTLPVRSKQQPVLPPVHHQPQDAERQQKPNVAQERFAQAALVPGDEHLVLLAIVQDVVHGRLKAGGVLQQLR
uniref:Uncharacterized protein n=1 Tax=Anopheles merus TaxID=30066 RepID=A0A182UZ87_ANOME